MNKTFSNNKIKFLAYLMLWIFGIVYWYFFSLNGPPATIYLDWYLQNVFLDIYRESLDKFKLPWFYSPSIHHNNHFFLANPEITITPDIILLKYFDNKYFIFFHISLFFSIGFLSLKKICKDQSFFSFYVFYLIFFFNGFLITRLQSGWFQYVGLFILPLIFLIISKMGKIRINFNKKFFIENKSYFLLPLKLGFCLSLLMFNGSFHIVIWILFFLIIVIFLNKDFFWEIFFSIIIFTLISFFRIFPGLFIFKSPSGFLTGYPNLSVLFKSLLLKNPEIEVMINNIMWGPLEFKIYVGPIVFLLFVISIIKFGRVSDHPLLRKEFIISSFIIFLLSYGNNYELVHKLPLLFNKAERISSRFIIISFFFVALIAVFYVDLLYKKNKKIKFVLIILSLIVSYDYFINSNLINYLHSYGSVFNDNINRSIVSDTNLPKFTIMDISIYKIYKVLTSLSFFISIISFIIFLFFLAKIKNLKNNT